MLEEEDQVKKTLKGNDKVEKARGREVGRLEKSHAAKEGSGMKVAYRVAAFEVDVEGAVDKLKGSFLASTSKACRDVKRSEVMKLAKLVASEEPWVFPLSQDMVEKVAACLKEAKMKSSDQYLNEQKLMHVEDGHD